MAKLCLPQRASEIMYHLVTHNLHGYSQYSRLGDGGRETITLSDGTQATIATGDRDCSSAVITAYQAAGLDVKATYTGNMRSGFVATGKFKWHPWGDDYMPQDGDIYLNETHHTAMSQGLVNGGYTLMEFSISEKGTVDGVEGDQTGWESHVRPAYIYSHGWDGILECTDRTVPIEIPPLPDALKNYTDIDPFGWYIDSLAEAVEKGYIHGYTNTTMGPTDILTRGQAVCMIANAAGAEFEHPYDDVTASPYYYDAVVWAKDNGVINSDNATFSPDSECTRQDFCTMLCNWKGTESSTQYTEFSDWNNVSDYARGPVAWAIETGLIKGSDNMIMPLQTCSRAEAATIMVRLLG